MYGKPVADDAKFRIRIADFPLFQYGRLFGVSLETSANEEPRVLASEAQVPPSWRSTSLFAQSHDEVV